MIDNRALTRRSLLAGSALLVSAAVAHAMVPRRMATLTAQQLDLSKVIPPSLGGWVPEPRIRLVEPTEPDSLEKQVYSQTLARSYRNARGQIIMLLVAYGQSQSEHLYLHRPELCYAAAGFSVSAPRREDIVWREGTPPLRVTRLQTRRETRAEPVTYWMRVGERIASTTLEQQMIRLHYGFRGEVPDGALFRISSFDADANAAFHMHDEFLKLLLANVMPTDLALLVGGQSRDKA